MQSILLGYMTLIVAVTLAGAAACLRVVPGGQRWVVERFGARVRVLAPGLNLVLPFVDRVKQKLDLTERVIEIRDPDLLTKDEIALGFDLTAFLKVSDPVRASYIVSDLVRAADVLVRTGLRSAVRSLSAEAILAQPARLEDGLLAALNEGLAQWGAEITTLHIERVGPSYPRYRVTQTGEFTKLITLIVPGFLEDEILVEVEANRLVIRGKKPDEDPLRLAVECQNFERRFQLGPSVEVRGARLTAGLLEIELARKGAASSADSKVGTGVTLSKTLEPKITKRPADDIVNKRQAVA